MSQAIGMCVCVCGCGSEQVTVGSKQHIFNYISYHWIKYLRYCGMLRRNNHNYNHRRFKNNKIVICKSIRSKNVAHCSHIFNKLIFLHVQRQKHKTQRLSACPPVSRSEFL